MQRLFSKEPFAKKSFGQNFLVDQNCIQKIIDALELKKDDIVVEIGAGHGALTERLLECAAKVIAIELDRDLIPRLRERFHGHENFELIEQDALKIDFAEIVNTNLPNVTRQPTATPTTPSAEAAATPPRAGGEHGGSAKLVANLPYNISTAILQRLMEQRKMSSTMILMFQREVVERITATPGNKERGFLSVLVEASFDAEKLFDVPPSAFLPMPKVWSSVVKLMPKPSEVKNEVLFRKILSIGFSQKRKTIHNNLKNEFADAKGLLSTCGIDPKRRAETLTLEEWKTFVNVVDSNRT